MEKRNAMGKASLTVEAALVLPVFVFAIVSFLYYFQILRLQDQLHFALTETAKEASAYGYLYQDVKSGKAAKGDQIFGVGFYQLRIRSYLDSGLWDHSCVTGGKNGVLLLESDYMENGKQMHLKASYLVHPSLPFSFRFLKKYTQEVYTEGFVGTEELADGSGNGDQEDDSQNKELVYVTKYGKVYHEQSSCSHIKLSIQSIGGSAIAGARNSGGGKYTPCEKCMKKGTMVPDATYYITTEGDCYHVRSDCPGLKRMLKTIEKKEAIQKGYQPCSGCSG